MDRIEVVKPSAIDEIRSQYEELKRREMNYGSYTASVPVLFGWTRLAEELSEAAKAVRAMAEDLSQRCADYAVSHANALDIPLHAFHDGTRNGSVTIDGTEYVLTESLSRPKRISGDNLTQGFLGKLPKAWVKSKLALHVSGMKDATEEELAKHDLARELSYAWGKPL